MLSICDKRTDAVERSLVFVAPRARFWFYLPIGWEWTACSQESAKNCPVFGLATDLKTLRSSCNPAIYKTSFLEISAPGKLNRVLTRVRFQTFFLPPDRGIGIKIRVAMIIRSHVFESDWDFQRRLGGKKERDRSSACWASENCLHRFFSLLPAFSECTSGRAFSKVSFCSCSKSFANAWFTTVNKSLSNFGKKGNLGWTETDFYLARKQLLFECHFLLFKKSNELISVWKLN